jgi:hypothetical protein
MNGISKEENNGYVVSTGNSSGEGEVLLFLSPPYLDSRLLFTYLKTILPFFGLRYLSYVQKHAFDRQSRGQPVGLFSILYVRATG